MGPEDLSETSARGEMPSAMIFPASDPQKCSAPDFSLADLEFDSNVWRQSTTANMAAGMTHRQAVCGNSHSFINPTQVVPSCCDGHFPLPLSSFLSHPFSPAHAYLLLASLSRIICTEPSLISKRALSHIHFAIRYIPLALQRDIAYAFSIACN